MAAPPTSTYREQAPPQPLARALMCTWTQAISGGDGPYGHQVLPDGCADIVWIGDLPPVVVGPASRSVLVRLPAGSLVVGARFRPGAAPAFLGPPASELADREIPLLDLWREGGGRLSDQLAAAPTADAKLRVLDGALMRRLPPARAPDPLAAAAVAWLARHPRGRVRDLGQSLGVSARQLQRRFGAAVGYGPKTFQRILRLQRLLALAAGPGGADLAGLAQDAGYADQAHMSREVRTLADRSPQSLLARPGSTLAMSDLFKTAAALDD